MDLAQKIFALRKRLGLTQTSFGKLCDVDQSTVSKWESGQDPEAEPLIRLAKIAGVSVEDFRDSEGPEAPEADFSPDNPPPPIDPQSGMVIIEEVEIAAVGGREGEVDPYSTTHGGEHVLARWQFPREVIRSLTRSPVERIKIITAKGDSNKPEIQAGDRMLIDTLDRDPSPAGLFAVWDGEGEILKRIEVIAYSEPRMVRMVSVNSRDYPPYEVPLERLIINGRVIGRWDRL